MMAGMKGPAQHERLAPGEGCLISEDDWYGVLEAGEPFHQWGSAFLVDEGLGGCVRVYVRDVTGEGQHMALRLDPEGSTEAREGVGRVETASRAAADHVTALQTARGGSLDEIRRQDEVCSAFVAEANGLYRDLLGRLPPATA